jgi:copper resistance protein C
MTIIVRSAIFTFGLCLISAPALAHAHLESATPAVNGTVAIAPSELDLTFSEGVNPKFTGAKVTGPGKAAVVTGAARLRAGGDTTLVVPISAPLAAGTYKVDWHALATDGHKTTGSYSFTVKP